MIVCTQFMIDASMKSIEERFGASIPFVFDWKSHVFPGYQAPVVVLEEGERVVRPMLFGLWRSVPQLNKKTKKWDQKMKRLHNARSETVSEKPTWSKLFRESRCLVPINSFFEYIWKDDKAKRVRFFDEKKQLLVAPGLWTQGPNTKGVEEVSFTILTKSPPIFIKKTGHDRCPVFLEDKVLDEWLDPSNKDPKKLEKTLTHTVDIKWSVEDSV